MRDIFLIIGSIFIALAAIFHVYVFILESLKWRSPKTWKAFGLLSQEHADIIARMAFNQGFYNLFLALGAGSGLALLALNATVGHSLIFFSSACMVGAGAVLFISVKTSRKAAIMQAGPPLIGSILILIGLSL